MLNEILRESPLLTFMFVAAALLVGGLIVYALGWFIDRAKQTYRRHVYAAAERLAREHPEWLAAVVEEHDIAPAEPTTREIAIIERRAARGFAVETAPRKELEAYAYRLQGALIELRGHYLDSQNLVSELREKLDWALDWKGKHWRRIQRVDEALQADATHAESLHEVFAALHPRLAREQHA